MKKKTLIILGLLVLGFLAVKFDLLSIISEQNLIIFYNAKDQTTTFSQGDPLAIDNTFVQWDLDRKWNTEALRDGKQQYERKLDGYIIWIDNKVYNRQVGSATKYGTSNCGSLCDRLEEVSGSGVGPDNCGAFEMTRNVCFPIYSDNYLNSAGLSAELMTQTEKNNLVGCHEVRACVARTEFLNLNSNYARLAIEHTCRSTRICWDGTSEVENVPPASVPEDVIDDVPEDVITPTITTGGGCRAFN